MTLKTVGDVFTLHRHPEMTSCFSQPGRQGLYQCWTPQLCTNSTEKAVFPESKALLCINSVFLSGFKQFLPHPQESILWDTQRRKTNPCPFSLGALGEMHPQCFAPWHRREPELTLRSLAFWNDSRIIQWEPQVLRPPGPLPRLLRTP